MGNYWVLPFHTYNNNLNHLKFENHILFSVKHNHTNFHHTKTKNLNFGDYLRHLLPNIVKTNSRYSQTNTTVIRNVLHEKYFGFIGSDTGITPSNSNLRERSLSSLTTLTRLEPLSSGIMLKNPSNAPLLKYVNGLLKKPTFEGSIPQQQKLAVVQNQINDTNFPNTDLCSCNFNF